LVIDIDPQGNTTSGLGIDKENLESTVYDLMINYDPIWDTIESSVVKGVSVIPSDRDLAGAEIELVGIKNREYILQKEVAKVKDQYDFILIDCPPSLSMLTINAMTTADTVIVPIQCEYYALEGLSELIHTINLVKERLNPDLEIEGVVFTMYDGRTCLSMEVVDNVRENLNQYVYKTIIPRNVRLAEAPSHGLPINMYEPKSAGAISYRNLAEEVIKRFE
jgi:chromosome partitioning protein